MRREIILLCIFIFSLLFCVGANKTQASGPTYVASNIYESTVWTEGGSPYVVNITNFYAPLEIRPGVVIKFKYMGFLGIHSSLSAIGSDEKKIIFTSFKDDSVGGDTNGDGNATTPAPGDWWSINTYSGSPTLIENSQILYGGSKSTTTGSIRINQNDNVLIKKSEIKNSGGSGIFIYQSRPIIESCLITNNVNGITINNSSGIVAKISNSSIKDSKYYAISAPPSTCYGNDCLRIDAKDNWWGDKSGPYFKSFYNFGEDNLKGMGGKVLGGVLFRPWLNQDPSEKREPVILIPGIGASLNPDLMFGNLLSDKWFLLSHTYDGIIDAFASMEYEEGKDFFIAYYDWRQKNEDSAKNYLEPLIKKALDKTGASKVNIIAHSMGGLVARSYVQGDDYKNDVDNLFLIATPNKGSSDVYPVWEGGYIPKNWDVKFIMRLYLNYLDVKKRTFSNFESVRQYIPSVKQLMPTYNYIYLQNYPQNLKNYLSMNEVNSWLENLNTGIQKLNERVKVNIISGNNQKTVNNIPIINTNQSPLWMDGKPEPLDPERNDLAGDERVLLSSSQIQSSSSSVLNFDHGKIVSQAEEKIAEIINEDLGTIYPAPDIPSELGFWFASPVNVEIKDPQGRIISGSANEIPLAKYIAESKPDGFKLVSIPNPISGDYEIKITGNGNGEFHIGSEYMDYKNGENDASSLLEGTINENEARSYIVKYDSTQPEHPVTPAFPEGLEAIKKYISDQKNSGTISSKEADFILVKLEVIEHLIERIAKKEGKENVIENYKEQANRQIDWLIDYIAGKSDKKNKGGINEIAKNILTESLNFIKF